MKIFLHRTNISSSNLKNYFHTPSLIKYPNSNFQSLGNKNFNSFELPKIFINYIGLAQFQLAYKNFEFFVERSHCIVTVSCNTHIWRIYPDTWINITCWFDDNVESRLDGGRGRGRGQVLTRIRQLRITKGNHEEIHRAQID